ncbi:MAG TPA: hypothetical protein VK612_10740, partial [Pyrinomonadaceae bacterium]|nr:hypothetical protein [Pyrinomonadaceae bacterium]
MANEFNNLGNDEQVADMLGTLNRVEAPSDFEMKVRSRIARSAPRTRFGRAELLLGLKFAIQALVLAAFGVFLAFSNLTEVNRSAVPPVEDFAPAATQPIVNPSNPQNNIRPAVNNSILARTSDGNTVNSGAKEKNTEPAGGSKDEALSPAGETIYPLGLDPNRK